MPLKIEEDLNRGVIVDGTSKKKKVNNTVDVDKKEEENKEEK